MSPFSFFVNGLVLFNINVIAALIRLEPFLFHTTLYPFFSNMYATSLVVEPLPLLPVIPITYFGYFIFFNIFLSCFFTKLPGNTLPFFLNNLHI